MFARGNTQGCTFLPCFFWKKETDRNGSFVCKTTKQPIVFGIKAFIASCCETNQTAAGSNQTAMWPRKTKMSNTPDQDHSSTSRIYLNLRKIQQNPRTNPSYPKIQIWRDFLHKQVVEGLGYVPGVCWSFLRLNLHNSKLEVIDVEILLMVKKSCTTWVQKNPGAAGFRVNHQQYQWDWCDPSLNH